MILQPPQYGNHAGVDQGCVPPPIAAVVTVVFFLAGMLTAQSPAISNTPVVLDRAIVVVNQQVILSSDLNRELRLSILDPNLDFAHRPAPAEALQHLVSRALIGQQFADQPLIDPAQLKKEVDERLRELRTELPACVRLQCATPDGWRAFLAESNLTTAEVEAFLREQIQILDFIEKRFRAGIHITPEQIADYYHTTLLPQYANPAQAPALEAVTPRINEILLEKQVNILLEDWLTNLRKEGDVEFLDSSLSASTVSHEATPTQAPQSTSTGGPDK